MTNRYLKAAIETAIKSGLYIKRSVGKIRNVSYKGIGNIVTDVDKTAEAMIIKKIISEFPDHSILSEESEPVSGASGCKWLIDPLDGTTNFAHSFPFFCVSIALEDNGELVAGAVYDPMRDELFSASSGGGAYLNRRRIHVSKTARLSQGLIATGFSYDERGKKGNLKNFRNFLMNSFAVRRAGSAALDLCYVACGRFDGFWEMDLHPWDSAAGSLIVKESKGLITRFNNSKYSPYNKDILATNGLLHQQMVKILKTS